MDTPYRIVAKIGLAAVGDILMHTAVNASAAAAGRGGYGVLFHGVAPELRAADITFANLETPVTAEPERQPGPFVFNAPPGLPAALKAAGIDVVSLANNHTYDQGVAGLEATLAALGRAGLRAVGAGRNRAEAEAPALLEAGGIRVAFLACTRVFNRPLNASEDPEAPWVNPCDLPRMTDAVREARRRCDLVVVSVHWGVEYAARPRDEDVNLAHAILDAGADAVLGHHPHVLQPLEIYRTADGRAGLIAYSLGNFISNQSRLYVHGVAPEHDAEPRDGVLLRFTAETRAGGSEPERTVLTDIECIALWTDNDTVERRDGEAPEIRTVVIDDAITAAQDGLARRAGSPPAAGLDRRGDARLLELERRVTLLRRRSAAIAERLGTAHRGAP